MRVTPVTVRWVIPGLVTVVTVRTCSKRTHLVFHGACGVCMCLRLYAWLHQVRVCVCVCGSWVTVVPITSHYFGCRCFVFFFLSRWSASHWVCPVPFPGAQRFVITVNGVVKASNCHGMDVPPPNVVLRYLHHHWHATGLDAMRRWGDASASFFRLPMRAVTKSKPDAQSKFTPNGTKTEGASAAATAATSKKTKGQATKKGRVGSGKKGTQSKKKTKKATKKKKKKTKTASRSSNRSPSRGGKLSRDERARRKAQKRQAEALALAVAPLERVGHVSGITLPEGMAQHTFRGTNRCADRQTAMVRVLWCCQSMWV